MKTKETNYLKLYLIMTFVIGWGLLGLYLPFYDQLYPIFGELNIFNPVIMVVLYAPTISGLVVYYRYGKLAGVKAIFKKLIPRKKDLLWFPIIFGMAALFVICMRFGSLFLGIPVPEMTFSTKELLYEAFINLFEETGLIGGAFGWFGFMLPYLQKKNGSCIKSGLLTGLAFSLFVMPGYALDSFETATAYPFYVSQLMVFSVFIAYMFNATKGNLLLYIFTFWLIACGSRLQFYYFIPSVQILQIAFFAIAVAITHYIYKKKEIDHSLQTFPEYLHLEL